MARRPMPPVVGPPQVTDSVQNRANQSLSNQIKELVQRSNEGTVASPSTGRLLKRRLLTGSGLYTPTVGTKSAHVMMISGGGGGGGANSIASDSEGAGGNSGWVLDFMIDATEGRDVLGGTFSCGAGGTGGTSVPSAGGTGGDTVLTIQGKTYTARGGTGGGATLNANGAPGVPSMTSTSGDGILSYYSAGSAGIPFATGQASYSGAGGGIPPFGSGGFAVNAGPSQGGPGLGFGAGGGGACADFFSQSGAAGSAGAIMIDEYS